MLLRYDSEMRGQTVNREPKTVV